MSTAELKQEIINRVSKIEDESLLIGIKDFMEMEEGVKAIHTLTPQEKKAVEEALISTASGQVYTTEEADKMLREWLQKK